MFISVSSAVLKLPRNPKFKSKVRRLIVLIITTTTVIKFTHKPDNHSENISDMKDSASSKFIR